MKKLVSIILVLVLCLSMIACATAENQYPLCAPGEIKMTMFASRNSSLNVPLEEHNFFPWMEEITGVQWDLQYVETTDFAQQLNLIFTGNDLPEVLFHCNPNLTASFVMNQGYAGTLLPLNDLIDQYAPNLKALLDRDPSYWSSITLPDGNIYAIPAFGLSYLTNEFTIINREWMEKLNLKAPTTPDELYEVLKAFKEQDPNGNGKQDEIPLCPAYGIDSIKHFSAWFGLLHDVYGNNYTHTDSDGNVVFNPYKTEEYKAYLKYFKKLYDEGLLDNDVFVQTNAQVIAKGSGDDQLIGVSEVKGTTNAVSQEQSWNYDVMPVLQAADGSKVYSARRQCVPSLFAITTACKHPEIAIQWVDYLFSEEGGRLAWMGKENVTYTLRDDGGFDWNLGDESLTGLRSHDCMEAGGGISAFSPDLWKKADVTSVTGYTNNQRQIFQDSGDVRDAMPYLYYDDMTASELSSLATDINGYCDQMLAAFITGTKDIDADWDEYINTLKAMNADRMLEIMQTAVNLSMGK